MTRELILFREMHVTTRQAAAKRLLELAAKVEHLSFTMGDHTITLPDQVRMVLEYEADSYYDDEGEVSEGELEFEIQWTPWEKMAASGMAG